MDFNKFFSELKRRNVYKVALTYAITSWLLAQIVALASDTFGAPDWVTQIIFVILVIGFPIALILAWAFELSPTGMIRTDSIASEQNPYPPSKKKPFTNNILIGVLAMIIIGQFIYNKYDENETEINQDFEKSIAVLPFSDLSSEGDTEWFCDGMTEDILTRLSKIKELKVISRSSVMQYSENRPSIPEIAKALGVSYILEGSVRKHEDKIIITAQLIDANDKHLWADNFNDVFNEVFEIQKKVSLKIVKQLEIAIDPYENNQIAAVPTENMKAYELLLKARSYSDRGTKEDFKTAIVLYEKALELDPNFLQAYIELASSYLFNGYLDLNNADENIEKVRYLIKKAADIDPESGLVFYGKGILNLMDNESEEAKQNFEKSLELNPNDAYANQMIAIYYSFGAHEDHEKSLFYINRAIELDPFSAIISEAKIYILLQGENIEEAEEFFKDKKLLFSDYNKEYLNNRIVLFKIDKYAEEKKDWTQAMTYCEKEIEKDPKNAVLYNHLGWLYDCIMNDDENYIKYTKKAYELDSTESVIAQAYVGALIEGKRFEEAKRVMNSENYKSIRATSDELGQLAQYHYHKEEYDLALEVLEDPLMENYFENYRALSLAQIGDVDGVRRLLNKKDVIDTSDKAFVFAILKNRDSMYYYMDKEQRNKERINSRREVDPYRKEQRYIEFLEKNYMPVTHWNK
jgi:TolB-like protein/Tfp pilus assembly protein PilF